MFIKDLCTSIVLLGCCTLYAQEDKCNYSILGKVIDEHNKEALEYATVTVKENGKGVLSDSLGNYRIDNLCLGRYTLVCQHIECEPIERSVYLRGDTVCNFYPEHHTELLDAFIFSEKAHEEEEVLLEEVISKKEMFQQSGKPLGEQLKVLNGVSSLRTGNNISKPVIHGLHSNRVIVFNNEILQSSQNWGTEHAPEIDPFIAQELKVIKGANSVRFGPDAIGGVVMLAPKPLKIVDSLGGQLSLGGSSNGRMGVLNAMVEGVVGKSRSLKWRLQGSTRQSATVSSPTYYQSNTAFGEQSYSASMGYFKEKFRTEVYYSLFSTDLGIFSGAHIGNLTDLQLAYQAEEPLAKGELTYKIERPKQHIEHELIKWKVIWNTSKNSDIRFIYGRQYNLRQEFDVHFKKGKENEAELQFELTTHTANLEWKHHAKEHIHGLLGGNILSQQNTFEGHFFIPNYERTGYGLYMLEQWELKKIRLEIGGRYDLIGQNVYIRNKDVIKKTDYRYSGTSFNLGCSYKMTNDFEMELTSGIAWRPPNISEQYSNGIHHGSAAIEIGDTSLHIERAYNVNYCLDYTIEKFSLVMDVYYTHIKDFIYLSPSGTYALTIRGAFPTFYYSHLDVNMQGGDMGAKYALSKSFDAQYKHMFVRAFDAFSGDHLVGIPTDQNQLRLSYHKTTKKKIREITASLAYLHVNKQWRTTDDQELIPAPEGYGLLNFQSGINYNIKSDHYLNLSLSIDNILNTKYRDYMNRFRYFIDDMGRNISIRLAINI